ncbi:MAG: DUF4040 domain-containing protein [Symbiobacteriaceae bacterium]|nr:DUF4040 domain-containing protein [Symbiobacteriaceae bacterium]
MYLEMALLLYLIVAAVTVFLRQRLLDAVIIYASYSVVLSAVWLLLLAPDLAITEAAVATGISGVLFFVVLKRIQAMDAEHSLDEEV